MSNQMADSQELQDLAALKQLHSGKGIAAIILGIISLIGCLGPISFICGVIAIIVGGIARKKSRKTTGTAGMVMGIIGVLISLVATLVVILMFAGTMVPSYMKYADKVEISQDTMVCDTVRSAITASILDPAIVTDPDSQYFMESYCDGYYYDVEVFFYDDCALTDSVKSLLGVNSYDELMEQIHSEDAYAMEFAVEDGTYVMVRLAGTDIEVGNH